jgi:hypothetical protein
VRATEPPARGDRDSRRRRERREELDIITKEASRRWRRKYGDKAVFIGKLLHTSSATTARDDPA